MTRRIGTLFTTLLMGCTLSGCALRSQNSPEVSGVAKVRDVPRIGSVNPPRSELFVPPPQTSAESTPPAAGFAPLHIQQTAQTQEVHEKQKPVPAPLPLIQIPEIKPASDALNGQSPALKAWDAMLKNRHPEAVEHLKAYDPQTQEFFLRMLPVMSVLAKTPWGQLTPPEASMISDALGRVQTELRPMTSVTLGTVCFCEWVKAYGNYSPMPEDYVFAAGAGAKAGELVHLYVELKHFNSLQRTKDRYETVLASSLEIRNAQGRLVRSLEFGDEKTPLVSRTPLNDYFKNYTFAMPELPPGAYSLKVVVRDETNRANPRTTERVLDIRVGPPR